ncbi:MAG: hypothetical protein DCC67_00175 [Planctomycetota bacterium]|nr:MAG: hypothetical protein DCC67_00175 [Planctomycetota bacterium]
MQLDDDMEQLVDGFVEGDLKDEQARQLCEQIRTDDDRLRRFVEGAFLHRMLFDLMRRDSLRARVQHEADAHGRSRPAHANPPRRAGGRWEARWQWVVSIAAAVALVFAVRHFAGLGDSSSPLAAKIADATAGAGWTSDAVPLAAGQLLRVGQPLELKRGRAVISYFSGAAVAIEGPARATITGPNSVRLDAGSLAATASGPARGFEVDTPLGRLVDLGTEFIVELQAPRSLRLFVFSGLVDLIPKQPAEGPPVKVPENRAVELHGASGAIKVIPFDGVEFPAL